MTSKHSNRVETYLCPIKMRIRFFTRRKGMIGQTSGESTRTHSVNSGNNLLIKKRSTAMSKVIRSNMM